MHIEREELVPCRPRHFPRDFVKEPVLLCRLKCCDLSLGLGPERENAGNDQATVRPQLLLSGRLSVVGDLRAKHRQIDPAQVGVQMRT